LTALSTGVIKHADSVVKNRWNQFDRPSGKVLPVSDLSQQQAKSGEPGMIFDTLGSLRVIDE
jgi:hypothetical protein